MPRSSLFDWRFLSIQWRPRQLPLLADLLAKQAAGGSSPCNGGSSPCSGGSSPCSGGSSPCSGGISLDKSRASRDSADQVGFLFY